MPARAANAASVRQRPGCEKLTGLGSGDRPDPVPVGETGRDVVHNGQQLSAIDGELLAGLLQREREPLDLGMTHNPVAAGISAQLPRGQVGQHRLGQGAAGAAGSSDIDSTAAATGH